MTVDLAVTIPPLVEPGPELTKDERERYSRHVILPELGGGGQRRLRNARVAVIGAGGLGSPVLTYLAAAGVGTIGVIDFDLVEVSNLQRQTIHGVADVGTPKTASAAGAIARLNPQVRVVEHAVRLDASNALAILSEYDLVIDGTDNFATRYLVNDACVLLNLPYVWGSVFRFEGQVSVFWAEHGPHYREVYPTPPPPGSVPSCGEGGVLGVVCATIGSVMATEAVKLICGIGQPLIGRLLVYDALTVSFRTVKIRRDPAAQPITGLVDYDDFCGQPPASDLDTLLTATELAALLAGDRPPTVIDVREPAEFDSGAIPGARSVPLAQIVAGTAVDDLRRAAQDGMLVLYCKSGGRSAQAARSLETAGVVGVRELRGGILAWADDVETSLPHY